MEDCQKKCDDTPGCDHVDIEGARPKRDDPHKTDPMLTCTLYRKESELDMWTSNCRRSRGWTTCARKEWHCT